jgi:hypothetical protein
MYWRCPESWRRRYEEHEIIPPGIALAVGSGVHCGAKANFSQKIETRYDLPEDDIVGAAVAGFEAEQAGGLALTIDEVARGSAVVIGEAKDETAELATLHAKEQAPDYQPVAAELRIEIPFPSATHDLVGYVDLIDDRDRVTDIKTIGKKPPAGIADESTQLTIYAAAFQRLYGKTASEVRLDFLRKRTKTMAPQRYIESSSRDVADFAALIYRINATLKAINAGIFTPASPGAWQCSPKWCGYWNTCRYVNSERKEKTNGNGN